MDRDRRRTAATAATAALLTAGAVEVRQFYSDQPENADRVAKAAFSNPPERGTGGISPAHAPAVHEAPAPPPAHAPADEAAPAEAAPAPVEEVPVETVPPPAAPAESEEAVSIPPETGEGSSGDFAPAGQAPLEATVSPADQAGSSTPPAYQPPPTSSTPSSTTSPSGPTWQGTERPEPGNPPPTG